MPLHNVYSASKGYIAQLTNNLSIEYPDIDWLSLNPAIVTTGMTFYRKDATSVTAEQCVSSALRDFGYEIQANGATSHKIQSYMSRLMPLWLFNLLWMKVLAPPRLQF
jgi:short-subunit dehydrogenase